MTYREIRSRDIVVMGRDVGDDVWGFFSTLIVGGFAWTTALFASLRTEDNLYSNVLVIVTICGLAFRTIVFAYNVFNKTESKAVREQTLRTEAAIRELREVESQVNPRLDMLDEERHALKKENDSLEAWRKELEKKTDELDSRAKTLKVCKWLVADKGEE